MTEVATPSWRPILLWILVAAALCSASFLAITTLQRAVSFDGGMNLQVAASLAKGDGYRRLYGDRPLFPQEIETKLPYILPAAIIYRLFGVGIVSSQVTGVLYFGSLLVAVYFIVRRSVAGSPHWAWLAVLLCTLTPALEKFGFHGYGEVAALSWFLWGCYVLFGPETERPRAGRLLLAGFLLGLSVATKVVLAIGVAAAILTFLISRVRPRPVRFGVLLRDSLLLGLGILAAQLPQEIMHFAAAKSSAEFVEWWAYQFSAITSQAGIQNRPVQQTGMLEKSFFHLGILARGLGIEKWQLALAFLSGAGLTGWAFARVRNRVAFRFLTVIGLAAAIHLTWWLLIAPTEKAWPRRALNGLLLFQVLLVLALGILAAQKQRWDRRRFRGWIAAAVIVFGLHFEWEFAREFIRAGRRQLHPTRAKNELLAMVKWLKNLSPEAVVFGEGWYAVPQLGLYSGRAFLDFNHWPPDRLRGGTELYLALGPPGKAAGAFHDALLRFECEKVFPAAHTFQIYKVDVTQERTPLSNPPPPGTIVADRVDFAKGDYGLLAGFHAQATPWRWMRSRGDALLVYRGEEFIFVKGTAPNLEQYRFPGGVSLEIRINQVLVAREHLQQAGAFSYRWPAANAALRPGEVLSFSLACDNVLMAPDRRQLTLMISSFGFTADANQ